jgi:hypothetical protein
VTVPAALLCTENEDGDADTVVRDRGADTVTVTSDPR